MDYAKAKKDRQKDYGSSGMKIYLDIFFAVNFLMNLLIFAVINLFLKRRLIGKRTIMASAFGALSATTIVVCRVRSYPVIFGILYLTVSLLMIRISYGKTTGKGMVGYLAGYYVTGVFVAGFFLYLKGLAGIKNISMIFLLAAAIIALCAAKELRRMTARGLDNSCKLCSVKISYHGKCVTGTGFVDTGNQLYEPVSHGDVTIVEYKLFEKLLSDEERSDFDRAVHNMEPELFGKLLLRYIPFHSLGGENDCLVGVRVDDMEIQMNDKETVHTGKTWLGLYDRYLSADGGYELLLNSRVFGK